MIDAKGGTDLMNIQIFGTKKCKDTKAFVYIHGKGGTASASDYLSHFSQIVIPTALIINRRIHGKRKVSLRSILQSYHRNTHPLLFLHPAWGRTFY